MKKKILALAFLCIVLAGCSSNRGSIVNTNATKALERVEKGDTFVLVVGTTSCDVCIQFEKVLDSFVKDNKVDVHSLKIDKEPTTKVDEKDVRVNFTALEDRIGKVHRTPTIFFIKDGIAVEAHEGLYDYDSFKKALQTHGVME